MAVLDNARTLVRDSGTSQRFTDAELNYVIQYGIGEVNMWAETTYVLADYESASVPLSHNQVMYLVVKIWSVQMDIQDITRFNKIINQDVQFDPDQRVSGLNKMLKTLQDDLEFRLKKLFGLDVGAYVAAATEFTEIT